MSNNTPSGNESGGSECPTCGDTFANETGVKVHHKRIHGESIAGVEVDCVVCGTTVTRSANRAENHNPCCSDECFSKFYSENYSGEGSPLWKGGKVDKECVVCGDSYQAFQAVADERKLCGDESCHREYKHQTAPKRQEHYNWKGGYGNDYGPNWDRQREKARQRDNHTCQACGVEESEYHRDLDVHHIRRKEWFVENCGDEWWQEANDLSNLVTLCMSCHADWEGLPIRPTLTHND